MGESDTGLIVDRVKYHMWIYPVSPGFTSFEMKYSILLIREKKTLPWIVANGDIFAQFSHLKWVEKQLIVKIADELGINVCLQSGMVVLGLSDCELLLSLAAIWVHVDTMAQSVEELIHGEYPYIHTYLHINFKKS